MQELRGWGTNAGAPCLTGTARRRLTGALYLERRSDVDHYMDVMNRLGTEALTASATTRFLRKLMGEL